jgi:hypothetical protein
MHPFLVSQEFVFVGSFGLIRVPNFVEMRLILERRGPQFLDIHLIVSKVEQVCLRRMHH